MRGSSMAVNGQRFMTKTQHYRKITKPLLERKRRARMNLYLDELKDLIVDTMEAQGEHVSKLEKADILELTVNYLKTQKHELAANGDQPLGLTSDLNLEKFRAGYTQAAYEVSKVFAASPGLNLQFGTHLMKRLGYQLSDLNQPTVNMDISNCEIELLTDPSTAQPLLSPEHEYQHKKIRTRLECNAPKAEDVWRPW